MVRPSAALLYELKFPSPVYVEEVRYWDELGSAEHAPAVVLGGVPAAYGGDSYRFEFAERENASGCFSPSPVPTGLEVLSLIRQDYFPFSKKDKDRLSVQVLQVKLSSRRADSSESKGVTPFRELVMFVPRIDFAELFWVCLLYTSPSPRD